MTNAPPPAEPRAVLGPAPTREGFLGAAGAALAARVGPRAIPLGLAALTILVFSPALLNGFVDWDDSVNLYENLRYRGLGWPQIRWMFTNALMGHYIPVTWLTFGLDYTLWGMNPLGYHLTSVLLHAGNAALFYLVALRLLSRATSLTMPALRGAAVMAALVFALHPLRAESVAWATERRDVLSGLFFLATVLFYIEAADAEGRRRRRLLAASVFTYALALLSKSIVMTLPLVLVLLDVYPLGRIPLLRGAWRRPATRAALAEKAPYLALGLAGAVTSYAVVAFNDFVVPVARDGWPARVALTGYSLWFYVEKTLVPSALSPLYERPAVVSLLEPRFLLSSAAALAISLALLALRRRWPAGLAVWAYYAISIAPVSGIVLSGHQLVHDRYSYLSCLGWALLIGGAVGSIASAAARRAVRPWLAGALAAVAAAWILALGTLTWQQIQIWRNPETLWRYAVESDPRCSICQGNLGTALYRQKLFGPAKQRFDLALALRPDRLRQHSNIGLVLGALGDREAGLRHLEIAAAHLPDDPDVLNNLGAALADGKRRAEALPFLERAVRIGPGHAPALVSLGNTLVEAGQPERGLGYLLRALELRLDEPVLRYDLARAYLALGRYEAARAEYDVLVTLDPERALVLAPAFLSVW